MWIETPQEFLEQHGNPVDVGRGEWVFADGATGSQGSGLHPTFTPPPDSELAVLRIKRRYWQTVLARTIDAFERMKSAARGDVDHYGLAITFEWDPKLLGPPAPDLDSRGCPDVVAGLKQLRKVVQRRRGILNTIEEQIATSRELAEERARERQVVEMAVDEAARRAAVRAAVEEIEI